MRKYYYFFGFTNFLCFSNSMHYNSETSNSSLLTIVNKSNALAVLDIDEAFLRSVDAVEPRRLVYVLDNAASEFVSCRALVHLHYTLARLHRCDKVLIVCLAWRGGRGDAMRRSRTSSKRNDDNDDDDDENADQHDTLPFSDGVELERVARELSSSCWSRLRVSSRLEAISVVDRNAALCALNRGVQWLLNV